MKKKHLLRSGLVILAGLVAGTLSFNEPAAQQASKLRILQTNFGGDSVQIIDPATNKVVGEIKGHEGVHGIVTSLTEPGSTSARKRRMRSPLSTARRCRR
jgi:hypothetical protein